MKRAAVLLAALVLAVLSPHASAEPWALEWEQDVGPGYITTSPLVDEERVYVRTSGFWTGEERPEVMAFTHQGALEWSYSSPTTVQHDMAPMLKVEAGSGPCGSWPDLLLVGWADGAFTALHPSNGTLHWQANSNVSGWGITGASLIEGDDAVIPTRNGLMRLCMADGTLEFSVELGEGWRNGVTSFDDAYWLGDEEGQLWAVERNGTVRASYPLPGSLRHAPVAVDDGLLLHVQEPLSSRLLLLDINTNNLTQIASLGASPALPLEIGNTFVFGDNDGLTTVQCEPTCTVIDTHATKVNGEMRARSSSRFFAPVNEPGAGWLAVDLNESGAFVDVRTFSTPHDDYGTSAPAWSATTMFLGNDAGVLMAYQVGAPPAQEVASETSPLWGLVALTVCLVGAAWLAGRGRSTDAWRVFTLCAVAVALLMLPDLSSSWSAWLAEGDDLSAEDAWDPSWPDAWLGTQVVVFELANETVVAGGLVGHSTVWDLTQAAVEEQGLTLEVESTGLGLYVVAIDGVQGSGWEYTVNSVRGTMAVDDAAIESTLVLRWHLA